MIPVLLIIFLFAWSAIPAHSQDIYSWVDEKGVSHFSDTPPKAKVHNQFDVQLEKVIPISKASSRHRLFHLEDDIGYCGGHRLPSQKEDDPRQKLISLHFAKKTTTARRKQLETELKKVEKNRPTVHSDYRKRLEYSIDECDCILSWVDREIEKLLKVEEQIFMEARQAEYKYEKAQGECGPEPPYKGPTDPEVIRWVECTNKNMQRRNRLLREKKAAEQREEALVESMKQD